MPIFVPEFHIPQSKPKEIAFNPASCVAMAMVFLLAAGSVVAMVRSHGAVVMFPANGLMLALLLTSAARRGMFYLFFGLMAYAVSAAVVGLPWIICLRIVVVSGVELLTGRALLRRYIRHDTDLSNPEYLWRFVLFAAVLAPAAATAVATAIAAVHVTASEKLLSMPFLISLFLGHGLGVLTTAPLALEARRGMLKLVQKITSTPSIIAFAALTLISVLVFWQTHYPLLYMVFPPLVGVVVIRGLSGGALGLFLIAVIAFAFTFAGYGPTQLMAGAAPIQKIILLQCFIAAAAGLALVLAAVLAERDRAQAALQAICGSYEQPATVDSLTGLFNRRRFDDFFEHEFSRAVRQGGTLSVLMLDIDLFSAFNEQYGDLAGDSCLRAIGEVLRNACNNTADFAARYGGEEFVVVVSGEAPVALLVAEAVRGAIAKLKIRHAGNAQNAAIVTVSMGVTTLSPELRETGADVMMRDAKALLYEAKRTGRNRIVSRGLMPTNPVPPKLSGEADRLAHVERVLQELRPALRVDLKDLAIEAATLMQAPIGAVTLVAEERQVFAGSCGLDVEDTPIDVSFCAHAITGNLPLVVTDATRDPRFAEKANVTGEPHLRFYAGAPIVSIGGHSLGVLCVASDSTRETPSELELRRLSQLAARAAALIDRQMASVG